MFWKNLIKYTLLSWAVMYAGYQFNKEITPILIEKSIPKYVEKNLDKIMKKQEEKLGIKHIGHPNVGFNTPPGYMKGDSIGVYTGLYNSEFDYMDFSTEYNIPPKLNLTYVFAKIHNKPLDNLKHAIDHELGHFYVDKVSESMGLGDYPQNYTDSFYEPQDLVMTEGIAEYFERTMNKMDDGFFPEVWWDEYVGKNFDNLFNDRFTNLGGYHLLKPILDIDVEEGVKYILSNPPIFLDVFDMVAYRNKTLEGFKNELEQNNKEIMERE